MKTRIGTVTAMTLCMGVAPLAITLGIAKITSLWLEAWSPTEFGVLFAIIHFALFLSGAWIYAIWIGD